MASDGDTCPKDLSLEDIYHIAFLLRQLLVPDLVPQILTLAGVFSTDTSYIRADFIVKRSQSPRLCLITRPIWSRVRRENPVVKVSFRIEARDHALNLNIGRSYFTVSIIRGCLPVHSDKDDLMEDGMQSVTLVSERHVVTNTIASLEFETHEVEWIRDAEDPEEAAWVAGLRAGDRLVVKGHADWATFENVVREVEVRVHTPAVVR